MIAMLSGSVAYRNDPYIILNVHGVGYKVLVNNTLLSKAAVGTELTVYTYTHVREDLLELYGFSEPQDLRLFELLIGVSGVGPKSAVGVFSIGSRSEIMQAISTGDVSFFTGVPRLGKKNAQKIIIDLKSKIGGAVGTDLDLSGEGESDSDEVIAALQTFGFSRAEAHAALREVKEEGLTTAEKIRLALKQLGK